MIRTSETLNYYAWKRDLYRLRRRWVCGKRVQGGSAARLEGRTLHPERCAARFLLDMTPYVSYIECVIIGFVDAETERFFRDGVCPAQWRAISKDIARKLDMLDAAPTLEALRLPPGNRLEALKADRAGQFSILVNDRWRVCFFWTEGGPDRVEVVDYH